jgi:cytochrome c oxidase subunit II
VTSQPAARLDRIPPALKHARTLSRLGGSTPRRVAILAAVIGGSLITAAPALANWDTVKSGGSPNANEIHGLYNIVFWVAVFVFVAVEGALVYAVWRFRAKKHPVASQIHGNTQLEIGLTASAAVILVILAVATFLKLPSIINPPNSDASSSEVLSASLNAPNPPNGQALDVCVLGRQFIWKYVYGTGCNKDYYAKHLPYSYTQMEVPVGETVRLIIQSSDVIHAWWIPKLGGKVDAVPGYTTYTWFKALHKGTFIGQCAQLCGREHAFMVAEVKAVPPAQYKAWVAQQSQNILDQNAQVSELRQLLTQKGYLTSSGTF